MGMPSIWSIPPSHRNRALRLAMEQIEAVKVVVGDDGLVTGANNVRDQSLQFGNGLEVHANAEKLSHVRCRR